jgi:thiol-disulfide isomerase/thioredoxin
MKISVSVFLLFFTLSMFSQKPVNLHVRYENPPSETVTIETFNKGWFQKKTVNLVNNALDFSVEIQQLEFFKISFHQNAFIVVLALPEEMIKIDVNMDDIHSTILVTGSQHTALLYGAEKMNRFSQHQVDSLIAHYNSLSPELKNQENAAFYQGQIDEHLAMKDSLTLEFIKKNSSSPVCLFFIEKYDLGEYYALYEEVALNLTKKYPENPIVQDFAGRVKSNRSTSIGVVAPDIKLPGTKGDSLSLYPLKGELVIIDFWASWCGPCRRENPHKVEVFSKYKDKGLAVFSVSLDNNGENWRKAIVDDKLSWPDHVSELKGWQSSISKLYGVSSIPANVIIDGEGKILAKNLRGKQLDDFIDARLK